MRDPITKRPVRVPILREFLIRFRWKKQAGMGAKKFIRRLMGWPRPIWCRHCRQFTRQAWEDSKRKCLSCGRIINRSRKAERNFRNAHKEP